MSTCPVRINTRLVMVGLGADAVLTPSNHLVFVTGVDIKPEAFDGDQARMLSRNAQVSSHAYITGASIVIKQEAYRDFEQHRALFASCGVTVVEDSTGIHISPNGNFTPVTIEVVEIGGTTYRFPYAAGTFNLEATPAGRVNITFQLAAMMEMPDDSVKSWPPITLGDLGVPYIYKQSSVQFKLGESDVSLRSCPSFKFTPEIKPTKIPNLASPVAQDFIVPIFDGNASLDYTGVLGSKESVERLWNIATQNGDRYRFLGIFTEQPSLAVEMTRYRLKDLALSEVEKIFTGRDFKFSTSEWILHWNYIYAEDVGCGALYVSDGSALYVSDDHALGICGDAIGTPIRIIDIGDGRGLDVEDNIAFGV